MNPQSTDKLPIDANADIPRIIYRDTFTITTSTSGSGYVEGSVNVTTNGFKIGDYHDWDIALKADSRILYLGKTYTSAIAEQYWLNSYVSTANVANNNSAGVYTITFRKYGGATTDSYTGWFILWSTKISEDIDLFA